MVQAADGLWVIVRGGIAAQEWWDSDELEWVFDHTKDLGTHPERDDALREFASLTPAQLAAPVGVEVK